MRVVWDLCMLSVSLLAWVQMAFTKNLCVFSALKSVNNSLTHHSHSGKHGRLGHITEQQMSLGRSLRSKHFI